MDIRKLITGEVNLVAKIYLSKYLQSKVNLVVEDEH